MNIARASLILALSAAPLVAAASCAADGKLTPSAATAINAAFAEACPLESMVPQFGPELVLACPGEEQAVAAALALDTAPSDAGAATTSIRSLTVQGHRVGVRVVAASKPLPASVLPKLDAGGDR